MDACFLLVRLKLRCRNEPQPRTATAVWTLINNTLAFHTYIAYKHSQLESPGGQTMKTLIALLALALLATTASADTVWNYQGNVINYFQGTVPGPGNISPFALTGSVTLNDQNVAVAWSFNDGLSTLTNFNSTGQILDSV